ncbi:MAG: hypothetical protein ABW061_07465 [Polyangiaceae bacterium]
MANVVVEHGVQRAHRIPRSRVRVAAAQGADHAAALNPRADLEFFLQALLFGHFVGCALQAFERAGGDAQHRADVPERPAAQELAQRRSEGAALVVIGIVEVDDKAVEARRPRRAKAYPARVAQAADLHPARLAPRLGPPGEGAS